MKYLAIAYVILSWVAMFYMADKIGELQTELKKPKEVVYVGQWGNAYDFVKEK